MGVLKLHAGHEVEVVGPEELESILRGLLGEAARERNRGPQTERPSEGKILTAGGASGVVALMSVPLGMEFALHRLVVDDDTHTPGAPYTNANGYVDVLRRGVREDFIAFTAAAGIPAVKTWSEVTAPRYRNGEVLEVQVVGGPASTAVLFRAQGTLQPYTPA